MLSIKENVSLKTFNTFKIDILSKGFVSVKNFGELKEVLKNNVYKEHRILGGGSNILFTRNFNYQ
jgi:UDP-N-acetylmuramate dehydrogenase